jgi:hypothetical protein
MFGRVNKFISDFRNVKTFEKMQKEQHTSLKLVCAFICSREAKKMLEGKCSLRLPFSYHNCAFFPYGFMYYQYQTTVYLMLAYGNAMPQLTEVRAALGLD